MAMVPKRLIIMDGQLKGDESCRKGSKVWGF